MDIARHRRRFPAPRRFAFLAGVAALAQCTTINAHVPAEEEAAFATDGVIARYHALLNTPFSHPLAGSGYIVGIEKSPRAKIRFNGTGADTARIQPPHRLPPSQDPRDLSQQQATFRNAMNDPKVMFVSHILRYGQTKNTANIDTDLIYSAYSKSAFGTHDTPPQAAAYEAGWEALDQMEQHIVADANAALERGQPFTHLMFLSMGWNNDQFEALERYNAIRQHAIRAAEAEGRSFNPLVIGLTWPSVWGGTSVVDLANRAFHIGSYPVKAADADEIGFGIANHMLNAMLPRIEAATKLQTVAVGHSMGARILTRAYYSADLLKAPVARTTPAPVMIGLQAAFSANRFRGSYRLVPPVRWMFTGEGGPYQDHAEPNGTLALTWATGDRANPVARIGSGAAHVGGKIGDRAIRNVPALEDKMARYTVPASQDLSALDTPCAGLKDSGKVMYIDASSIIASHGDILNPKVGELVWRLTDCLGPAKG